MGFDRVAIVSREGTDDIKYGVMTILTRMGKEYVENIKDADLVVVIGGDGTLFRHHMEIDRPIFGIKQGTSIGHYMYSCEKDYEQKLEKVLGGEEGRDYHIKNFMKLECSVNGKRLPFLAMNEFLISAVYTRKMLNIEMQYNGELSIERCSGIIVYTPSGSTAFAGSAGGKHIDIDDDAFGVVALAPYQGRLKNGSVIIRDGFISFIAMDEKTEICGDGQDNHVVVVSRGDIINITKSREYAKIITF